jgi:hypothetical protein
MFQKDEERVYDDSPVYYVYYLVNPTTNVPFYVGKGKNRRCYQHLGKNMGNNKNRRLTGHIRNLRETGNEPIIVKSKEGLTEEESFILEESEIIKYGRKGFEKDGILLNIFISNRPIPRFGESNGFYGKQHSEETKKIISEANKGRKRSIEHRLIISKSNKGKPKSEEHRRKIGDKSRGRKLKEETKQKLREHNLREEVLRKNIESKQKEWIVTTPEGIEEYVVNLSDYCVKHNLSRSKMYTVAKGVNKHHRKYKCRKFKEQ